MKDATYNALKAIQNLKGKIKPCHQYRVVKCLKREVTYHIPISAEVSAMRAISGEASGIAKTVDDARLAKHQLEE